MLRAARAVLILLSIFFAGTAFRADPPTAHPPRMKTIIIDPGHGGKYIGCRGLISTEKEVTLEVSLKLGEAIVKEFPDLRVVYTRTTDACSGNAASLGEDLQSRARIANQSKGDLFISIHCNATPQPAGGYYAKRVVGHKNKMEFVGRGKKRRKKLVSAPVYQSYWVKNLRHGTESYIWKADRNGFKGEAINEKDESGEAAVDSTGTPVDSTVQAEEVFEMSSPEARMRAQLYEKRFFGNSFNFAKRVEDGFAENGRESGGVKQRDVGIRVLQATGMPSVLVEIGFLTNKEEEEYLNSDTGQNEVVDNIVAALRHYREDIEK